MHFRPLPSAFNSTLARQAGQTRISSNCSLIAIGQHLAVKIKSHANATNEGSKLISIARFVVGIVVQWRQEIGFVERSSEPERMTIEDFGPRVTSVWNDLRSTTRSLLERAWRSPSTATATQARALPYDPRADQELMQMLAALDERAREAADSESARRARRLADACAEVLAEQTQSAEVFARLIQRAHERRDFARVDALTGALSKRLAPTEICELARSANVVVRALAQEALTQMPT